MEKIYIYGLSLTELENILKSWQEPSFHARQIFNWIYRKGICDFAGMSDLSAALRAKLQAKFIYGDPHLVKGVKSTDDTEKFLLGLDDGASIEAVIIPAKSRVTGCISTQVGCKYSCQFCASGIGGFKRNLTCAEIIGQVMFLNRRCGETGLTHLVFMGTGEPFDNYENVIKSIRIINSDYSLNIGARRITISTSGIVPGIERLAQEGLQVELSISLHAADDKIRTKLMPVNKIYPLDALIKASKAYVEQTGRQITFEYCLIKGANCGPDDALNLSRILKKVGLAKVNLIPANPVKEHGVQPPADKDIDNFREILVKEGINITLRRPRGQDIDAACGQLRLVHEKE